MARDRQGDRRHRRRIRWRDRARPPPHDACRGAATGRHPGRCPCRTRAGDRAVLAKGLGPRPSRGTTFRLPSSATRKATGRALRLPPRPPTGSSCSRTNGRFYTIPVDRLPGGRGQGEPLRLMVDLPNEHDIVEMFPYRPGMELLVAASDGRGFVVDGEEAVAQTRAGKQVLTPAEGAVARICLRAEGGDAVAFVGDNRRMLVVKLDDTPADDARPRRDPAALQIGRPRRRQGVPPRRRPHLAAGRDPHPHRNRLDPVARRPRRRRPPSSPTASPDPTDSVRIRPSRDQVGERRIRGGYRCATRSFWNRS